jgi:hypothetical protein
VEKLHLRQHNTQVYALSKKAGSKEEEEEEEE